MAERKVDVQSRRIAFDGFFKLIEATLSYSRVDGAGTVGPVKRLMLERGDSAAILVHDLDRDVVMLAEQFRFPAFEKDPASGWLTELVAGSIEANETPETCVRREVEEEIGYRVDKIDHIATFFVSPGGTSERIWLYYAAVRGADFIGLSDGRDADEDIARIELARSEFIRRCTAGEITDAKTLISGLWLKNRT